MFSGIIVFVLIYQKKELSLRAHRRELLALGRIPCLQAQDQGRGAHPSRAAGLFFPYVSLKCGKKKRQDLQCTVRHRPSARRYTAKWSGRET